MGTYCACWVRDSDLSQLSALAEWDEPLRTINFKGDIVSDTHRMRFGYIEKIPVALCLALFLVSGFAQADDSSLAKEANAALAQKDYNTAFSKFTVLAQHGNATAQFNLGAFYLNGQGVQKDEKQAYEWFGKSAAQGNAGALKVLQNAAAKGNESAKNELNKIQSKPASAPAQAQAPAPAVPRDEKTLLTEANTALAQKDYNTAFPKFLALAQQGNATAQFNVGAFYFNGQGVQKDEKRAYDWFAKSAAQGNARAIEVMQNAAAKQNEQAAAKSVLEAPAPSTAAAAPRAASERQRESSGSKFTLGVSAGATSKITGVSNSSSFGLLAGYRFNPSWGVELAYNSLYRNANANTLLSATYPGTTGTFDLSSVSAVGQYTYGLSSNVSLLGNLGVHSSSYKINSSGAGAKTGSSTGLVVGGKVQYELTKSIGIRGGFDTYTESGGMSGNITEVGISVINRF
ncbi:Sel1 repeat protein [mine drainage metagenome]|uniref:Sel1 repeat protein n=1 Tax=mine drainage metagenome TaxID=410659 RepID=A0A1J5RQJ9_9ZZZZ